LKPTSEDLVLNLGAAGNQNGKTPVFEDYYEWKQNVVATNIEITELTSLKRNHNEVTCVLADGCCLPFRRKSIDILFSNAVIEHLGETNRQKRYADEVMRVSKRWLIETPNFWFPFETHWQLPLIHFLPEKTQRRIMQSGKRFFVDAPEEFENKLPKILIRMLNRYFSDHQWSDQGLHLLSATKLHALFPTSKIKKQRTTFYPEVLLAYNNQNFG
jgi:hypothetical protein